MQTGTSGPDGKGMKQSALGLGGQRSRSHGKVTKIPSDEISQDEI